MSPTHIAESIVQRRQRDHVMDEPQRAWMEIQHLRAQLAATRGERSWSN